MNFRGNKGRRWQVTTHCYKQSSYRRRAMLGESWAEGGLCWVRTMLREDYAEGGLSRRHELISFCYGMNWFRSTMAWTDFLLLWHQLISCCYGMNKFLWTWVFSFPICLQLDTAIDKQSNSPKYPNFQFVHVYFCIKLQNKICIIFKVIMPNALHRLSM